MPQDIFPVTHSELVAPELLKVLRTISPETIYSGYNLYKHATDVLWTLSLHFGKANVDGAYLYDDQDHINQFALPAPGASGRCHICYIEYIYADPTVAAAYNVASSSDINVKPVIPTGAVVIGYVFVPAAAANINDPLVDTINVNELIGLNKLRKYAFAQRTSFLVGGGALKYNLVLHRLEFDADITIITGVDDIAYRTPPFAWGNIPLGDSPLAMSANEGFIYTVIDPDATGDQAVSLYWYDMVTPSATALAHFYNKDGTHWITVIGAKYNDRIYLINGIVLHPGKPLIGGATNSRYCISVEDSLGAKKFTDDDGNIDLSVLNIGGVQSGANLIPMLNFSHPRDINGTADSTTMSTIYNKIWTFKRASGAYGWSNALISVVQVGSYRGISVEDDSLVAGEAAILSRLIADDGADTTRTGYYVNSPLYELIHIQKLRNETIILNGWATADAANAGILYPTIELAYWTASATNRYVDDIATATVTSTLTLAPGASDGFNLTIDVPSTAIKVALIITPAPASINQGIVTFFGMSIVCTSEFMNADDKSELVSGINTASQLYSNVQENKLTIGAIGPDIKSSDNSIGMDINYRAVFPEIDFTVGDRIPAVKVIHPSSIDEQYKGELQFRPNGTMFIKQRPSLTIEPRSGALRILGSAGAEGSIEDKGGLFVYEPSEYCSGSRVDGTDEDEGEAITSISSNIVHTAYGLYYDSTGAAVVVAIGQTRLSAVEFTYQGTPIRYEPLSVVSVIDKDVGHISAGFGNFRYLLAGEFANEYPGVIYYSTNVVPFNPVSVGWLRLTQLQGYFDPAAWSEYGGPDYSTWPITPLAFTDHFKLGLVETDDSDEFAAAQTDTQFGTGTNIVTPYKTTAGMGGFYLGLSGATHVTAGMFRLTSVIINSAPVLSSVITGSEVKLGPKAVCDGGIQVINGTSAQIHNQSILKYGTIAAGDYTDKHVLPIYSGDVGSFFNITTAVPIAADYAYINIGINGSTTSWLPCSLMINLYSSAIAYGHDISIAGVTDATGSLVIGGCNVCVPVVSRIFKVKVIRVANFEISATVPVNITLRITGYHIAQ